MRVDDKLVYTVQFEDIGEVARFYEQLISIPFKHRKKEAKQLIEELSAHIENSGVNDE